MYKNISIIILLILFGCGEPEYREIMVNKTIKVFLDDYHDRPENYTFKWKPPVGPNDEKIIFNLKNDMLIFTPEVVGYYEVKLSIEDISEKVVDNKIFYFKAIPETMEVAIVEPKKTTLSYAPPTITQDQSEKETSDKSQNRPGVTGNNNQPSKRKKQSSQSKVIPALYAIQISAWPTLEEARNHQLQLIDEGFDAYTQRLYLQESDEVWYRVRIGNFTNKNIAIKMKKQIESITGKTTWMDILSTK